MVNNIFKKPSHPTHFHSVFGILLLLTEWIQVECLYISLLDQIVTHGQHRYLQGNLEMWFRDHYPVVTNPTVKSYVITLSFQEIILMAENHYPKSINNLNAGWMRRLMLLDDQDLTSCEEDNCQISYQSFDFDFVLCF